jgi:peptide-methionine (S)-S-oxide reductase
MEKATLAAGCFWGVEATFRQVPGVLGTRVGYSGGHTPNPTYEQVCTGKTGHAESIEVTFDPARVSYEQLVDIFFSSHNPTTRNRQGFDIGTQYRSAIFFHTPEQEAAAQAARERVQERLHWPKTVVTEVAPAAEFYPAEDYHQRYLEKRGRSSCTVDLQQAVERDEIAEAAS